MKKWGVLPIALVTLGWLVSATDARPDQKEIAGPISLVPFNANNAFYGPSLTVSPDGTQIYLFIQAAFPNPDHIRLYTNPNNHDGYRSQFTLNSIILSDPNNFLGGPSVFQYGSKYYMTISRSPDANIFHELDWLTSTDGIHWTTYPFLLSTNSQQIPAVSLQYAVINGTPYFWGLMGFTAGPPQHASGLGAVRAHVNLADPRGYDYIEIFSAGAWTRANADGTFAFNPQNLWLSASDPKLFWNGTYWEIWANVPGPRVRCGCTNASSQNPTGFGDRFFYRAVDTNLLLGPVQAVGQDPLSPVRCLPAGYDNSRTEPLPLFDREGILLLYSATNDQICRSDFFGQYTVMTRVVSPPLSFFTLTPCRVLDTRNPGYAALSGPQSFPVSGLCGVPAGARSVSFNATVVGPTTNVLVSLNGGDATAPGTNAQYVRAGNVRAGASVVELALDGTILVSPTFDTPGQTHFILDVNGYFQ
jgi:hypothetical protein